MKNTFGTSVAVTIFGESHGAMIGAVLDGLAPGIEVDEAFIASRMDLRRSVGALSTARREADIVRIVSGVVNGRTTGTPITLLIENGDTKSQHYDQMQTLARPGHADLTAYEKYHGFSDTRGGGHFSGRITAGLVAAGAIAMGALEKKGIRIGTHLAACGGVEDRAFGDVDADIAFLRDREFAALDEAQGEAMKAAILAAKKDGILETAVTGLPAGVGEPWFDTVEGVISHILFSIPAIKGVEFGAGFALASLRGSEANDPFRVEGGRIVTATNNCGGILGGITNGMPLIVRCAVKPTPSIYIEQDTVNFKTVENARLGVRGRHDPAIIHRARVVVDCAVALVLCDMLAQRFGTDWLRADH